jgi:hypothetical protein
MRRRDWLLGLAASTARLAASDDPFTGGKLHADVRRYWRIGEHRTGTVADQQTSEWLQDELRRAGFETRLQTFELRQWFPRDCLVNAGGRRVLGFPLWPVSIGTVEGELGKEIAVLRLPYDSGGAVNDRSPAPSLIEKAAAGGARAVVLITEGPTGEAIALNAERDIDRWPVPVLLVGPKYAGPLTSGRARLVVDAEERPRTQATNVQGWRGSGAKSIVISTPKSGWFRCAGERGPGVAMWLAMARAIGRRQGPFRYVFTANSGHELHGLGMKAFLKEGAPKPAETACWIHFGAGIATFRWEGDRKTAEVDPKRYLTATPDVVPLLEQPFAGLAGLQPRSDRLLGELVYLGAAGYRCFGIAAGHRFHHVVTDGPETTSPELLEPVARAFLRALEAVESRFT